MTLHDVVVVGAGPSGAACAAWLAEAGRDVVLLEKKSFPREKTCGDGLTPRAVHELDLLGLTDKLAEHHRFEGLRAFGFGRTLHLRWPDHPVFPSHGYVVTRHALDEMVASRAVKAGAALREETEAVGLITEDGILRGIVTRAHDADATEEVRARYTVLADGANSRMGRALGTSRDRDYPQGMAIRGYYTSPRHDEPWIESHLDLRDRDGNVVPGYAWIFPVGDGRVNVGIGVLSTFHQWKAINTSTLMDAFAAQAPESWGLSPATACGPPTGGRLPMGMSVTPRVGPTWLVVGDAGGLINPFNGEGIAYAYESGRYAADAINEAIDTGRGDALQSYERRLQEQWGLYFRIARPFVKLIGRPEAMRVLVGTGMRSRTLMEWVLRIMANLLRPDELGPAEVAYRAVARLARLRPA